MGENTGKEQNAFLTLLDLYFDVDEMKKNIEDYLAEAQGATKWMLYSDYCLGDKTKPNDVITFALMPFMSEDHYLEIQESIKSLQPTDIKKTRHINPDFLYLLKKEPIYMVSFILDGRKDFFGTNHVQRVSNVKDSLETIRDCYIQWRKTAANSNMKSYFEGVAKTINSKVTKIGQSKNPNIKLLSDILSISFAGAYFSFMVLENVDVETFGWFSDRDNIISGEDNIIVPIFNYYLHNLWKGNKLYQFCTMTPDSSNKPFYDEFNRMVDVVTGAVADYDMKANAISADKFDTVLTEYTADNSKYSLFRFYTDNGNLRLARVIIKKKCRVRMWIRKAVAFFRMKKS